LLLYNQRKEFVGIDEDDLSNLDFQNINELQSESHDFADLFVKKPGYIHNFKNFSWIDFILHSEAEEAKAIVHAKGKNYTCTIHITPFHFSSEEAGYAVILKNLRALKGAEDAQASKDLQNAGGIQSTPAPSIPESRPVPEKIETPSFTDQSQPELDISLDDIQVSDEVTQDPAEDISTPTMAEESPVQELPSFENNDIQELNEPEPLEIPDLHDIDLGLSVSGENEFGAPIDIDYNAPLTLDDDVMKDDFEEPLLKEESPITDSLAISETTKEEQPMLGDYVGGEEGHEHLSDLVKSGDYQYDPNIAANELGLPVDLIEEFIGDFIDQAHEFHDDLYASVKTSDFDNVQILSHKLKGVAANLRVEDAFDVLSVVNISKDAEAVLANLNQFYRIIAKLEGKEVPVSIPVSTEPVQPEPQAVPEAPEIGAEEDDYNIGIKQPDDGPLLIDEDVMQVPEDDLYSASLDTIEEAPSATLPEMEEDIYDDLLAAPELAEPVLQESNDSFLETENSSEEEVLSSETSSNAFEDDIYDDMLATPDFSEPSLEEESSVPLSNGESIDEPLGVQEKNSSEQNTSIDTLPPLQFDIQTSANELGIPLVIVQDFVQEFKEQVTIHQQDFNRALENQDIQEINKTATLLKGMSDNLRLNDISEVLKKLQIEKDINNTAQALASLQAYADQL